MLETLNLLEGYDLKAMGHNSPDYIHTLTEAIKLAFADRDRWYGDPAGVVDLGGGVAVLNYGQVAPEIRRGPPALDEHGDELRAWLRRAT